MATIAGIEGFAARAIDVRSDGAVVLGDDGGAVHFLASGSLTPTWTVDGRHRGVITAAVLGNRVIAGHQDGSVALSRRDGTWRRVVAHEYMAYTSAAIDDGRVATGGLDGTILVWTGDEAPAARLEHGGSVFSLSVAQHSGALLSAGADRWIEWDVATGEIRHAAYDIGSGIHTLADIDASGSLIVTVGENARLVVWQNRRAVATWPLPYQDSSAIRVLPDGSGALVAFNDGVIGLVALDTGEFVELHRRHDCWIRQLLVSGDGRFMVSCSQNGVGAVYDRRTGRVRPLGGEGRSRPSPSDATIGSPYCRPRARVGRSTCSPERRSEPRVTRTPRSFRDRRDPSRSRHRGPVLRTRAPCRSRRLRCRSPTRICWPRCTGRLRSSRSSESPS